jgi:hypothetical protein
MRIKKTKELPESDIWRLVTPCLGDMEDVPVYTASSVPAPMLHPTINLLTHQLLTMDQGRPIPVCDKYRVAHFGQHCSLG